MPVIGYLCGCVFFLCFVYESKLSKYKNRPTGTLRGFSKPPITPRRPWLLAFSSDGSRGGQGAMSPQLMTVWRKAVRVAIVVTQCFDIGNDEICRVFTTREDIVQCSFCRNNSAIWLSHSQPGMSDWIDVLEVWTWTYYSAEANTQMRWAGCTKIRISRP